MHMYTRTHARTPLSLPANVALALSLPKGTEHDDPKAAAAPMASLVKRFPVIWPKPQVPP